MANVTYFFAYWVGAEGNDLYPGQSHRWIMWGFNYGDALSVSAHPVAGPAGDRYLTVQDIQVEADESGRRFYFTVKNVGSVSIPGYGMGFSQISN